MVHWLYWNLSSRGASAFMLNLMYCTGSSSLTPNTGPISMKFAMTFDIDIENRDFSKIYSLFTIRVGVEMQLFPLDRQLDRLCLLRSHKFVHRQRRLLCISEQKPVLYMELFINPQDVCFLSFPLTHMSVLWSFDVAFRSEIDVCFLNHHELSFSWYKLGNPN